MKVEIPNNLIINISCDDKKCIKIWNFYDAPEELQKLSTNGGDEDYIAFIPDSISIPIFLDEGGSFGCCCVDKFEVIGGTILIGCHS